MAKIFGDLNNKILEVNGFSYPTLFNRVTGSRLYGTQFELGENPNDKDYVSDYDYKGIFVAPFEHHMSNIIQVPSIVSLNVDDVEFYELKNFITLASDNNPNIMDILFGDEQSLIYSSPQGQALLENKHLFLSQKVKDKFIGYGLAQLTRIKNHHKWMTDYPEIYQMQKMIEKSYEELDIDYKWINDFFGSDLASKVSGFKSEKESYSINNCLSFDDFCRKHKPDFDVIKYKKVGLSEFMTFYDKNYVKLKYDEKIEEVINSTGTYEKFNDTIIHIKKGGNGIFCRDGTLKVNLQKNESAPEYIATINYSNFNSKNKEILAIWEWKVNRNPKRSLLEEKFGYDTKHGMHLYRLLRSVNNLIDTGEYNPRLSGEFLKEVQGIRNGDMSYEELLANAENLKNSATKKILLGKCDLPKEPNYKAIDKLMLEIYNSNFDVLKPENNRNVKKNRLR